MNSNATPQAFEIGFAMRPQSVSLRCQVCNRPMGNLFTWDGGQTFTVNALIGEEGSPRRNTSGAQLAARVYDVSNVAMTTGVYGSESDRFKFVCRGERHTRERPLRRETLWALGRRALNSPRPTVIL